MTLAPQRWFAPADGLTRIWVDMTLRSGDGNPIVGRMLRMHSTLGSVVDGGLTDVEGHTFAYVTSRTPGDALLTTTMDVNSCDTARTGSATVTFTLAPDDPYVAGAEAPYLNGRIQVEPQPITRGVPSVLRAKLTNPNDFPIAVDASFAIAQRGIGLTLGPIGSVSGFTVAAKSDATIEVPWTPLVSGHYCVKLQYSTRPAGDSTKATMGSAKRVSQKRAFGSGSTMSNLSIEPGKLPSPGEMEQLEKTKDLTKVMDAKNVLELVVLGEEGIPEVGVLLIPEEIFKALWDWTCDLWIRSIAALSGDPPRQDFQTIATLETYTFSPLVPSDTLPAGRAEAANAMMRAALDLASRLSAARISLGSIQWCRRCRKPSMGLSTGDGIFALQTARRKRHDHFC